MTTIFSIIIPHFGIPELLRRCLSSIPRREDVQIIVIDDGSPDYETYPDRFPELFQGGTEWIPARHGGAGHARNIGLDQAIGKWVLFADADDYFSEGLNEFLDDYRDSEAELIFFRTHSVLSNDSKISSPRDNWYESLIDQYFKTGDLDDLRFNHGVPWGKMVSRSFLARNQIRFEEIPYSNDSVFSALAGSKAKTIQVVDRILYIPTEREGSLTWQFGKKPGELEIRTEAAMRVYKIMRENDFHSPRFPLSHYLYKMFYNDRSLFRKFFRRIPEVYPSYWTPVKEMAANEHNPLRKGIIYAYSLFTRLTIR